MIGLSALHEGAPEISITFSDIEILIESQLFEIKVSLISLQCTSVCLSVTHKVLLFSSLLFFGCICISLVGCYQGLSALWRSPNYFNIFCSICREFVFICSIYFQKINSQNNRLRNVQSWLSHQFIIPHQRHYVVYFVTLKRNVTAFLLR